MPIVAPFADIANAKIVRNPQTSSYAHNEKGEFIVRTMINDKEVEIGKIVSLVFGISLFLFPVLTALNVKGVENENDKDGILCEKGLGRRPAKYLVHFDLP